MIEESEGSRMSPKFGAFSSMIRMIINEIEGAGNTVQVTHLEAG